MASLSVLFAKGVSKLIFISCLLQFPPSGPLQYCYTRAKETAEETRQYVVQVSSVTESSPASVREASCRTRLCTQHGLRLVCTRRGKGNSTAANRFCSCMTTCLALCTAEHPLAMRPPSLAGKSFSSKIAVLESNSTHDKRPRRHEPQHVIRAACILPHTSTNTSDRPRVLSRICFLFAARTPVVPAFRTTRANITYRAWHGR